MAGGVNKAFLIGHCGKDPVIREVSKDFTVAAFSLGTTVYDARSNDKKRTDWHSVQVHNQALVGVVQEYVKKGSKLNVEGEIQTRKYTDKQGVEKYITEIIVGFKGSIVLLDRKEGGGGGAKAAGPRDYDTEIPF